MYFKSIYHDLQLPCKTAACNILLKVIPYSSSVAVWEYMPTDLIKSTFEEVLLKMSYSVDTLPTEYLDYLTTKDDSHLNTFHVATSECVKIGHHQHRMSKMAKCPVVIASVREAYSALLIVK